MMLPRLCVGNAASCFGFLGQDENQAGPWVTNECSNHKGYAVQLLSVTFLCAGAEVNTYLRSPQHPSQLAGLCFMALLTIQQVPPSLDASSASPAAAADQAEEEGGASHHLQRGPQLAKSDRGGAPQGEHQSLLAAMSLL